MARTESTPTTQIRNVVLLGHGGTGKTALAEALLRLSDVGDARGGNLDFEPEERDRGHSLGLATASFAWRDCKINLLDTPGTVEFIGDAFPALRAADVAVFVVDAAAGLQQQHDELWAACAQIGLPRLVFLNKLDQRRAAYQANIDALRERCGKPLAPCHMPIGVGEEFDGVIDLLRFVAVRKVDGRRVEEDVPEARREQAERNREFLVEAIVENDDELLARYLDGEVPAPPELAAVFARGIAREGFFPVLCGSTEADIGVRLLADFLVEECPGPDTGDAEATTVYVAKTLSDPYVGRINILRVMSGDLRRDDTLTLARTGDSVRLHQLFALTGREQTPLPGAPAGDILAVAKLEDVVTGDLLTGNGSSPDARAPSAPEPYYRVALEPVSAGDEDKLSTALARLGEEDPSLRIERNADTGQLVLRTYGPTHVDVTLARMERKFGVSVAQVPLRVAYRETLRGPGKGIGKHVKQSGGHGQYGIAHVEVAPLERGEGFRFVNRIVGGAIPGQFIGSVEKGVREAMSEGVLASYPVVDVEVTLIDGKYHSVDSSDMAFQVAGALAFRSAAEEAGMLLLEPILEIEVTVPDELTGDVMGDLSGRRGRIQGTDQARPGRTAVQALVPEAETLSYVAELRSLTSGMGTVTMRYDHHDVVPEHVARRVREQASDD